MVDVLFLVTEIGKDLIHHEFERELTENAAPLILNKMYTRISLPNKPVLNISCATLSWESGRIALLSNRNGTHIVCFWSREAAPKEWHELRKQE